MSKKSDIQKCDKCKKPEYILYSNVNISSFYCQICYNKLKKPEYIELREIDPYFELGELDE